MRWRPRVVARDPYNFGLWGIENVAELCEHEHYRRYFDRYVLFGSTGGGVYFGIDEAGRSSPWTRSLEKTASKYIPPHSTNSLPRLVWLCPTRKWIESRQSSQPT